MLWGVGRLLLRTGPWLARLARTGLLRAVVPLTLGLGLLVAALPRTDTTSFSRPRARVSVLFGLSHPLPLAAAEVSVAVPYAAPPAPTSPPSSLGHAVVVGINHAHGGPALLGAVADALTVKQALLGYGFKDANVQVLLEAQASRDAILRAIDRMAATTPAGGVAVLALAGHSRLRRGSPQFLAADGARITASELAAHLSLVRARLWTLLATCFAEGFALPGVVGPGRVATFASRADQEAYELGPAGSYLVVDMVRYGMIDGWAPWSVESAFAYARASLERTNPDRVPFISDGVPGDLVLGPVAGGARDTSPPMEEPTPPPSHPGIAAPVGAQPGAGAPPSPDPTPPPDRSWSWGLCGSFEYHCRR